MEITYFVDRNSLYRSARNFMTASVRTAGTEIEHGRFRHITADSGVIGRSISRSPQSFMQEMASNLSAAINISTRGVGSVVVNFPLYIKRNSSMKAFSSVENESKEA